MTRAPANQFQPRQADPTAVAAALARIEEQHRNGAWAAVLGGSLLCLLTALALTLLYFLFSGFNWIGDWGFKPTYLIIAVVCLPALFLLAAKAQRPLPSPGSDAGLLADRGREGGSSPLDPVKAAAERANMGPRLVLWGVQQVRGRSAFGAVSHERLSAALATLVTADAGVPPVKLLLPGESADQLEPLLGALLHHDMADLSKNADRVWITTEGKRKVGLPV